MKVFRHNTKARFAAAVVLAAALTLVLLAPPLEAGMCETALKRCMIEAGMAALIGLITCGPIPAALLGEFCIAGYLFCLQYCE